MNVQYNLPRRQTERRSSFPITREGAGNLRKIACPASSLTFSRNFLFRIIDRTGSTKPPLQRNSQLMLFSRLSSKSGIPPSRMTSFYQFPAFPSHLQLPLAPGSFRRNLFILHRAAFIGSRGESSMDHLGPLATQCSPPPCRSLSSSNGRKIRYLTGERTRASEIALVSSSPAITFPQKSNFRWSTRPGRAGRDGRRCSRTR